MAGPGQFSLKIPNPQFGMSYLNDLRAVWQSLRVLYVVVKPIHAAQSRQRLDNCIHQVGIVKRGLVAGLGARNGQQARAERLG